MTREEAAELLPIIKAFSEGKVIQTSVKGKSWEDLGENIAFYTNDKYRTKPEPKYRPFANAEECWNEMQKHQPFGWVIKHNENKMLIGEVDSFGGVILYNQRGSKFDFDEANRILTFADGTPFGVKEE